MPTLPGGLIELAIEPKSREDHDRLVPALVELTAADGELGYYVDDESGQVILHGSSEVHLDRALEQLMGESGLALNVGAPQVAYRECITRSVQIDRTHSKVFGPKGEFARVTLNFEPGPSGSGFVFENAATDRVVPKEYLPGVEAGLEAARSRGLLAGFPVTDLKATLVDGVYHDIDSSVRAFDLAARAAFKALKEEGRPILLEPIMRVEVLTPDEYMGDVIGDLNSRRGQIQGIAHRHGDQAVTAFAPLSNMLGYSATLRSFTQGRAQHTIRFDHYEPVPVFPEAPDPDFSPAIGMRA